MAPPRAVTFDFWNTLVHEAPDGSRPRRVDAWLTVLDAAGLVADEDAMSMAFDQSWEVFQRHWRDNRVYRAEDAVAFVLGRLKLDPRPSVRDELVAVITDPPAANDPQLTPNVATTLATLREAGIRIGIICDVGLTPSRTLRRYLEAHGVLDQFDHWSFSDEVGVFKPDAVIFRHALEGLGIDDPATAAHVGDLRRTDVAGANAAGLTSVRYTGAFDDPGPGEEATIVVADHADLAAALGLA